MKFAILFLIGGGLAFAVVIVGLSAKKAQDLSSCLNQTKTQIENNIEAIKVKKTTHHQLCQNNKSRLAAMRKCYETAERENFISLDQLLKVGRLIKEEYPSYEELARSHNIVCPEYPVTLIPY